MTLNVLSLFAGIGGLELGLERAGMRVIGQVEIDDYCRRVLAKHWPDVPRHDDVRTATEWWQSTERPTVDVICGGFPCQPFSHAGVRLGLADERWGWPWFADVIRMVGPRYVLVENVAALLRDRDAFGLLLRDLAALRFDAEWSVLSACAMGAPHTRERLFVVAYPHSQHGPSRMGTVVPGRREGALSRGNGTARSWTNRVDRSVETSRSDDRDTDGFAPRLVAMGGNAVVPQVAEYVGRLIVTHAEQAAA